MASIGDCCCDNICPSCNAYLAAYYDSAFTFNGTTKTVRINKFLSATCPNYSGYLCWSAASALIDSCELEYQPVANASTVQCTYCFDGTNYIGKPEWTQLIQSTHTKHSIARWDKTAYSAQVDLVYVSTTKYRLVVVITYKHLMRWSLANCLQFVYAIATHAACADVAEPPSPAPNHTITYSSWVGYAAITLPAHVSPFNDSEASVISNFCTPQAASITFCKAWDPTDGVTLTPNSVTITNYNCVGDPYGDYSSWVSNPQTQTVFTGEGCCVTIGTFGSECFPAGNILTQTIEYRSGEIDCSAFCGVDIELTRVPISGEADPPVDIAASTLTYSDCSPLNTGSVEGTCPLSMDRPLIAKPAKLYVTLCP